MSHETRPTGNDGNSDRRKPVPDKLYTLQDLSDLTGVPLRTLYNARSLGRGPRGLKVGRTLRFTDEQVTEWLESMRESA